MGGNITITLIYQTARGNKRDIRMSCKSCYFVPVPYPFLASKPCGFSNSPRKFFTMPCGGPVNSSRRPEENKNTLNGDVFSLQSGSLFVLRVH